MIALTALALAAAPHHSVALLDTTQIERLTGAKGKPDRKEGVFNFAMLESELQPVLKTLRHADIEIIAIHQHMTGEKPRIMFLHYWGIGRAEDLARGVRAGLDQTHPQ